MTYTIHPAAAMFPRMNDAELKELTEDIKKHGLREPIKLNFDESILIDGRNRLLACDLAGTDTGEDYLVTEALDEMTEEEILDYIVSANIRRRHLTAGQKAMLAAELEPMYAAVMTVGRPKKGEEKTPEDLPEFSGHETEAREQAAAAVGGISGRSVSDAKALKEETPDLAEKVAKGDMTLGAATKERKERANKPEPAPEVVAPQPGRSRKPNRPTSLTEEQEAEIARLVLDEDMAINAADAMVTGDPLQKQGTKSRAARAVREAVARRAMPAEPMVDASTLTGTLKVKAERLERQIRKEVEQEFAAKLAEAVTRYRAECDVNVAEYKAKITERAERERAERDVERERYKMLSKVHTAKGLISPSEYMTVLACLHPDNSASESKRAEAFRIFNDTKVKALLVKEVTK